MSWKIHVPHSSLVNYLPLIWTILESTPKSALLSLTMYTVMYIHWIPYNHGLHMSNMVKERAVSFKKDQIAALY